MTGRSTSARRRGRPPLVKPDELVEAALAIGLEQLTMQDVAKRLGVSSQALYRWVGDRDELLDLVADSFVARIMPPRMPLEGDWRAWLFDFTRTLRAELLTVPGIAARGLTRFQISVAFVNLHERVIAGLVAGGVERGRAVWVAEVVGTGTLAWVAREQGLAAAAGGRPRADADARFDAYVATLLAGIGSSPDG
ncbi:TetR/AcrR family transcriptional regulator [Conexibacter sp. CPCC 206217]|uniref:TetR/AcrR family transcriptional regulator n=1 Tax=Conexibacter sp. CPCC 206217 TaxID=3064574 RepID=UPI00271C9780|nr:TetR/AcrR family transcriptional regulator [Conexibacter sp. CPCC 206217]MDO8208773.1 TetR/AcrR family transcriptional regulator [Conexibacter sp. CPCC 206217]